jgi:hypothetical protein
MSARDRTTDTRPSLDRGQAFTLEGVLAASFLVIALLIALQTTVITPTTGGAVDDETRSQLRQKANDVLVITANDETNDLSWYVRFWNPNTRTFYGAQRPEIGYGNLEPPPPLGEMLTRTFTQSGRRYNLILRYRGNESPDSSGIQRMVYQGPPAEHAVVATHTVTLYDSDTLSGPQATSRELQEYDTNASDNDDSFYPIPDVVEGPVYNVVEVRLVVW